MNTNFLIARSADELEALLPDYFVARIDGAQAQTLRQFYEQIAQVLDFPDYFGYNLDSLDELLNDLDWIEDERIVLYVENADLFVSKERDPNKLSTLLNLLDATAEDWKWLDDTDDVAPKALRIAFDDTSRIRERLDREEIAYTVMPDEGAAAA